MPFSSGIGLNVYGGEEISSLITHKNSSDSPENYVKTVKWSIENEKILVGWADIAQCYNWLNTESYAKYRYMHIMFTIPTITLSTLTGTAAFAITGSLGVEMMIILARTFGTINIIIGVLSTIQQYLRVSELREQHRAIAISWGKFSRNIKTELTKDPMERVDCKYFLKSSKTEFDRLMEITPYISQDIINKFILRFQGEENTEQRRNFVELNKPEICETIISTNNVRNNWYKRFGGFEEPQRGVSTPRFPGENSRREFSLGNEKPKQLELPKHSLSDSLLESQTTNLGKPSTYFLQ